MGSRLSQEDHESKIEIPRSNIPRRKRLLVNPQFQAVFAFYAVLTTLFTVPIFIVANYYFFNLFSAKAHSMGLPPGHELLQFVDRQQALMVVVFMGAVFVATIVNLILSYLFSNRIAGSLYRLKTVMNQAMDAKSAAKIHPREVDFFKDVYEAYNHLIDRLRS